MIDEAYGAGHDEGADRGWLDAPGEIARRLARAREEIAAWREYHYLIINRDVKDAVDQLATIIQAERCRTSRLTLRFPDVEVPE